MSKGSHETEIKLAVPDVQSARRMLRRAGFRVTRPRVFEANTVFDTATLTLRKSARLLRVRTAGTVATLTFKGKPVGGRHKSREELERIALGFIEARCIEYPEPQVANRALALAAIAGDAGLIVD